MANRAEKFNGHYSKNTYHNKMFIKSYICAGRRFNSYGTEKWYSALIVINYLSEEDKKDE